MGWFISPNQYLEYTSGTIEVNYGNSFIRSCRQGNNVL